MVYCNKNKYSYNPNTLQFDKVKKSYKKIIIYFIIIIFFSIIGSIIIIYNFDSPKEKILKEKNEDLYRSVQIMSNKLNSIYYILDLVISKDTTIYSNLFDTIPNLKFEVSDTLNYKNYDNYNDIVEETFEKIVDLESKIENTYYDLDKLENIIKNNEIYFQHIPAIQPISNKNLKRTASGWGYRKDPIYHIKKFHFGLDFSAKQGTPIYATGNGIIEFSGLNGGYGNCVIINHGYGYKTLYGHMVKTNVKNKQKINRGDIIGYVGSTGFSTGPHLHYEVIKNNKKINPIGFFFNDLTPDEYDQMIKISNSVNKTYD